MIRGYTLCPQETIDKDYQVPAQSGDGRAKRVSVLAAPTFERIRNRLRLPLIAAPMFLVSGVELVSATAAAV